MGRCWEGLEFLVRRWCGDGVEKVRGKVFVSVWVWRKDGFWIFMEELGRVAVFG